MSSFFMHRIGSRLLSTRGVRFCNVVTTAASQIALRYRPRTLWNRSGTSNARYFLRTEALSVVALSAISGVHTRAYADEEHYVVHQQQLVVEKDGAKIDETTQVHEEAKKPFPVNVVHDIFFNIMDSATRTLFLAVVGTNFTIHSAFALGAYLNKPPNPRPTLLRFLSRNFILSLGWLSRGRWHVLATSSWAHLATKHFLKNTASFFCFVTVCSMYINAWQIAGLYFVGSIVGSSVSMILAKMLRKTKYMGGSKGASDGIYALMFYYICTQDAELPAVPWVPFPLLIYAYGANRVVKEGIGLHKYLQYGYRGRGRNAVTSDHAAHLGGAGAGLLAYGVPWASRAIRRKTCDEYTDGVEGEDGPQQVDGCSSVGQDD